MILADAVFTGIRQLATLVPGEVPRRGPEMSELGVVEEAEIAVRDGHIAWVGRSNRRRREVRLTSGGRTVDLGGACVVPGFVDAHTHVLFGGDRSHELTLKVEGQSYLEIAQAGGGLLSTVRATRRASTESLRRAALARLAGMAAGGTTSAEVKSGYALTLPGELRLLRLVPGLARSSGLHLVPTFLGAHAIPPEYAGRADDYVDLVVKRMLPAVAAERLARFCDVFCEPGFFSVTQAGRILRAALGHGLEVKIHADEFVYSGGARLAAEMHVRSAEHLLAVHEEDRAGLAEAGVTAVLLPVTPFASLSGTRSPGREMV
ncbi:MAG TPA: imidazolonepropionase, partial [Thermoplasmata archaeon]|nr:imidazolonepropionase [Thermoplasmata archaeon]